MDSGLGPIEFDDYKYRYPGRKEPVNHRTPFFRAAMVCYRLLIKIRLCTVFNKLNLECSDMYMFLLPSAAI